MDLIDLIEEKQFVGQEFLVWLWWKSCQGSIHTEDGPVITLVGRKMTIDGGERGRVVCSGDNELVEALRALAAGKQIQQAQFKISHGDGEYIFTLSAPCFDFKAVKLPRTIKAKEAEEIDGLILERIYLIESLRKTVVVLFKEFVKARLGDGWDDDVGEIRSWIFAEGIVA